MLRVSFVCEYFGSIFRESSFALRRCSAAILPNPTNSASPKHQIRVVERGAREDFSERSNLVTGRAERLISSITGIVPRIMAIHLLYPSKRFAFSKMFWSVLF